MQEKAQNFKKEKFPEKEELQKILSEGVPQTAKFKITEKFKITDLYSYENGNCVRRKTFVKENIKLNAKLSEKDKENNECMGLYILYNKSEPVYVGISGTMIRRMKQHFFGKNHNESSLGYRMALEKYLEKNKKKYEGHRKRFPYEDYREEIQETMKEWEIAFIPETDNYKLYFKEIAYACILKTYWNSFETH